MRNRLLHDLVSKQMLVIVVTIISSITLWRLYNQPEVVPPIDDQELARLAMTHTFTDRDDDLPHAERCQTELGRDLFFDTRLSQNATISCATCHVPELAFTDGKPVASALGVTERNTPTLVNMRDSFWFFWDGRADSLAAQMLGPLESNEEHGFSRAQLAGTVLAHYRQRYERCFGPVPGDTTIPSLTLRAYPPPKPVAISQALAAYTLATRGSATELTQILLSARQANLAPWQYMATHLATPYNAPTAAEHDAYAHLPPRTMRLINTVSANTGLALAAFQRTIIADDAPFDRFVRRLSEQTPPYRPEQAFAADFDHDAWKGFRIFADRGQCTTCHQGPTFSDQQFHNIGLAARGDQLNVGRAAGIQRALNDPFNCLGGILPRTTSESCLELPYLDTDNLENVGAFKTPTLRNLASTAPYMHDGRFASLDDVLTHYNLLTDQPALGHREETLKPMQLAPHELLQLTKFLQTLNSEVRWLKPVKSK